MLHTTKGIVFHYFKYAEKSVITKIYTEKFGLQSFIINGVRGQKSKPNPVYLQPLSLVEINGYHKKKGGLQQVKNIKLDVPFQSIPFNIHKSSMAFFIAEILSKSIKEEEPNPDLFNYLFNAIQVLDLEEKEYANFHLIFLVQLIKYLGFFPQNQQKGVFFDLQEGIFSNIPPPHQQFITTPISELFFNILGTNFDSDPLQIDNNQRKTLLTALINFYSLHLSNFGGSKSRKVLEDLLN